MIKKYKLKNGETRYQFQLYLGTDSLTGKPKRTTRRGFKTKKEADLELSRLKLELERGELANKQLLTFKEVYELWLPQYEYSVEESTYIKTVGIFKNHILPALGEYYIDKITIGICQKAVNTWFNELKNFRMVISYASRIFNFCIKRELLQRDTLELVEIPKKKKNLSFKDDESKNFYTAKQLNEFLSCLEREPNYKIYAFFHLLAYTGIRKGEALALTWQDVNFNDNLLLINKAISKGKNNKLYLKGTKTNDIRKLGIDPITTNILKKWKIKQKQNYLKLVINTSKQTQLIFSNNKNDFLQPSKTREWIRYIQKKYNLKKITTHGLRHTHCSLLFESGASLKEVQERLGHSDAQTTMNIYTHISKDSQKETINKFANYLKSE